MISIMSSTAKKLSQRSTEQRKLISRIIAHNNRHLDADEIYQQARLKSFDISLSTVYRNLQFFKTLGLVEEHQFGSRRYYETASPVKHYHMVCRGCGWVFEFRCPESEKLKDEIGEKQGFRVTEAKVNLVGYCPDCQKNLFTGMSTKKSEKHLIGVKCHLEWIMLAGVDVAMWAR